MGRFGVVKVACVTMFLLCVLAVAPPRAEGAVTCGQVASSLSSCIKYLTGTGGAVPGGCCGGVKSLNNAAKTTPDRQAACRCLKSISGSLKGFNYGLAASLPGKCGVNIPYKISPSTDCNSVK